MEALLLNLQDTLRDPGMMVGALVIAVVFSLFRIGLQRLVRLENNQKLAAIWQDHDRRQQALQQAEKEREARRRAERLRLARRRSPARPPTWWRPMWV